MLAYAECLPVFHSGLGRPRRRDDTRVSSSFSMASFRRSHIDDLARSNVSRQLRSPLTELPSFERPASSIWRRKSCAAVGLVGHPRTDEVRSKKLEKMRSVQSSRCWASVRRLSSSAQKRLCRSGRVTVETVERMTSYINDVIIEPNDIIMQNEPIDKLFYYNVQLFKSLSIRSIVM